MTNKNNGKSWLLSSEERAAQSREALQNQRNLETQQKQNALKALSTEGHGQVRRNDQPHLEFVGRNPEAANFGRRKDGFDPQRTDQPRSSSKE